jgi:hypothetical protein
MVTGALEAADSIRHGSPLDENAGAAIRALCVAVLWYGNGYRCFIPSWLMPAAWWQTPLRNQVFNRAIPLHSPRKRSRTLLRSRQRRPQ